MIIGCRKKNWLSFHENEHAVASKRTIGCRCRKKEMLSLHDEGLAGCRCTKKDRLSLKSSRAGCRFTEMNIVLRE